MTADATTPARPHSRPPPARPLAAWSAARLPRGRERRPCIAYLALDLHPVDLAATTYRADLFADHGLTIWNGNWYGGHHTLAYSVLFAAARVAARAGAAGGAPSAARRRRASSSRSRAALRRTAAPLGRDLVRRSPPPRSSSPAGCPFALGVAFGLGGAARAPAARHAASRAARGRSARSTSPVAGLFLAMAGDSPALAAQPAGERASRSRRAGSCPGARSPVRLPGGRPAAVPVIDLFWPLPGCCGRARRSCRAASARCGSARRSTARRDRGVLPSTRRWAATPCASAPLFAGPVLACALGGPPRRPPARVAGGGAAGRARVLAVVAGRTRHRQGDRRPGAQAVYYRPLLGASAARRRRRLARSRSPSRRPLGGRRGGAALPLARGWQRQLDTGRNPIFYDGHAEPPTYADLAGRARACATWRSRARKPDYSSYKERALIETRPALPAARAGARRTGASTRSPCPRRS